MATLACPRVSVDDFLADTNINERAELLFGEVYEPVSESFLHLSQSRFLERALAAVFGADRTVRDADLPLPDGRPRPDVVVLQNDFDSYDKRKGYDASDALLVVEVCLSTHDRDYGPKDRAYAAAGIPEYWIIDLDKDRVEKRTEPTPLGYAKHEVLFRGSILLNIEIDRILGEPSREVPPASV